MEDLQALTAHFNLISCRLFASLIRFNVFPRWVEVWNGG